MEKDNENPEPINDAKQRHSAPPLPDPSDVSSVIDNQPVPTEPQKPEAKDLDVAPVTKAVEYDSDLGLTEPDAEEFTEDEPSSLDDKPDRKRRRLGKLFRAIFRSRKFWIGFGVIVAILVALVAVPRTRYDIAGLFVKGKYELVIMDSSTQRPVSNATVSVGGVIVETDAKGHVVVSAKVGDQSVTISKKYYATKTISILVPIPIISHETSNTVQLQATGRLVPITITNKINGKPIAGALIRSADTKTLTDKNGNAVIVLPADKPDQPAILTAVGYNDTNATIKVTEQADKQNDFQMTPAGQIYFLSNLSGRVDVVKTDLDGANRQIVLAGTGYETDSTTVLIPSLDWKYAVLESIRDQSAQPKLYLFDTSNNDKLTTIDNSNASFKPIGWSGSNFIYILNRNGVKPWQPGAQMLKSYNAATGKATIIDSTSGEGNDTDGFGYGYTEMDSVFIVNNSIVYAKNIYTTTASTQHMQDQKLSIFSVNPDGSNMQDLKDFTAPASTTYFFGATMMPSGPQSLNIQIPLTGTNAYYVYQSGKLAAASLNDETFNQPGPEYFVSPDGKHTFWSEARDGKNTLLVGDSGGQNSSKLVELSDFSAYGWYGNDYLLLSSGGSELYIMPVSGGNALKITDYHDKYIGAHGYGYGFGFGSGTP